MKRFLILGLLICSFSGAAPADVNFALPGDGIHDAVSITFTDQDLQLLAPLLNERYIPGSERLTRQVQKLPTTLRKKIQELGTGGFSITQNEAATNFSAAVGLSTKQAELLESMLEKGVALKTIDLMKTDPNLVVRFLSRDMDSFYYTVLRAIKADDSLSPDQKMNLAGRIRLVQFSRPISKLANPTDLLTIFQLSQLDLANASQVLLLDTGYAGTMVDRFEELTAGNTFHQKAHWSFIWKAPWSKSNVEIFPIESVWANIKAQFGNVANEPVWQGDWQKRSVRVALIEHQPKWINWAKTITREPVYLMLDLDDTVIKEAPASEATNSAVQSINYKPDSNTYQKYAARLVSGSADPNKVVHYQLHPDGTMTGYLMVRPAMKEFFADLEPLRDAGLLHILVTSSNDENRTRAIMEQVQIGGQTLSDMGASFVPRSQFGEASGKSPGRLRTSLQLPPQAWVIAIDDSPEQYVQTGNHDLVFGVKPFNTIAVRSLLTNPSDAEWAYQDYLELKDLGSWTYSTQYGLQAASTEDRLRILAGMMVADGNGTDVGAEKPPTPEILIKALFSRLGQVSDLGPTLTKSGNFLRTWIAQNPESFKNSEFTEEFFKAMLLNLPRQALSPFDVLIITGEVLNHASYSQQLAEEIANLRKSNMIIEHVWQQSKYFNSLPSAALYQKLRFSADGSQFEIYDSRPDILEVPPKDIVDLPTDVRPGWEAAAEITLEFAAMLVEVYSDYNLVFAGRDGESFYDMTRLILQNEPERLAKLHIFSMSQELKTNRDENLPSYFRQQIFRNNDAAMNEKYILVDNTLWRGSTLKSMRSIFPKETADAVPTQVVISFQPEFPSLRTALLPLIPNAHLVDPNGETRDKFTTAWERVDVPHFTKRAESFLWNTQTQKWSSVSSPTSSEEKESALRFMAYLKSVFQRPDSQKFLDGRRALWREARNKILTGDHTQLYTWLVRVFDSQGGSPFAEAFIRDVIELTQTNFLKTFGKIEFADLLEKGLVPQGGTSMREILETAIQRLNPSEKRADVTPLPGPVCETQLRAI